MNSRDLFIGFNEVDDDILERSEQANVFNRIPARRRLSIVLIAAILALFLLGAGAATGLLGDSIQSWFAHYWETLTGQSMSDQHTALIDHLSQEIGLSETAAGVTVTVDSATVGEANFFILLRIQGVEFTPKHTYGFEEAQVVLSPESITDDMGSASYSYNYLGLDPEGAVMLLIKYYYSTRGPASENPPPLQVTLSMTNLTQDIRTNNQMLLVEGLWNFTITLDRNAQDKRQLPDTQVMGFDYSKPNGKQKIPIVLTNIELTNSCLYFRYDRNGGDTVAEISLQQTKVVLKNGREISASSGAKTIMADDQWYCTYFWQIPVELDEVVAIKIGEVEILVE